VPTSLVVDANPLLAALLGGRAREIVFSDKFQLCAAQATLFEVAKHIPRVAAKVGLTESHLFREFQLLPIEACQPAEYGAYYSQSASLIAGRDPHDVPTLALALSRNIPIWSNDKDFQGLAGVQVFTTSQLLDCLA
jgi:predicted nucleic acid-binding protein